MMMFKSIKHKLNNDKQNFSTIVREINGITDDTLNPLNVNKEGVFGIEAHFSPLDHRYFNISPSHYMNVQGIETVMDYHMFKYSMEHLHCYSVEFMQPSFLPLKLEEYSLWDYLSQLANPQVEMFVQLLIYNGENNWRQLFTDQYIHYLMGNDYPLENKLGRQLQTKVLKGINRIAEYDLSRERNPHIEYKIKDNGYRFNMRIILHSKDARQIKIMEKEIQEILSTLDFYNQLVLFKEDDKEEFIYKYTNRIFTLSNQILSETELMSMFMSEGVTINVEPVKQTTTHKQTQSGLELLPRNAQTSKEIDPSVGEGIITAIRELGLAKNKRLEIVNQVRSATLQKVTMKIPNGVKFSDIEKNYKDMKAILGYESFTIEQGDEPGTVSFMIPMEDRDIVYLRDLLESGEFKQYSKDAELPLIVGMDTLGEPLLIDLAKLPHLIIAGATGGGKSYFLHCLILTLLITKKPSELKLYLIDPKKVEFTHYKGFPHMGKYVVTDVKEAISLLDTVCVEMDKRYDTFAEVGVRDLKGYNKKFPHKKLPYIVTIIDEIADLMMLSGKEVEDYIVRLSQLARAAGIHIILATQRPEVKVITGIIKSNVESRIAFSVSSGTDSRIILDSMGAEKLLGKGDGLAKTKGQKKELIRFQSPVIALEDDEIEGILVELKNSMNNGKKVDVSEENDTETIENEEEPIEKLKRIILETNEFRIKELQQLMNVSINKVNALMIELLSDGFLAKDGRGYKLNNND